MKKNNVDNFLGPPMHFFLMAFLLKCIATLKGYAQDPELKVGGGYGDRWRKCEGKTLQEKIGGLLLAYWNLSYIMGFPT